MDKYLFPDVYVDSILDLPLEKLSALGIRAFILDLDNTVTEWNNREVREEVYLWIKKAKEEGFQACIASNNNRARVLAVAEELDIPFVHKARKPLRRAFYRAMAAMGSSSRETAVIGDQIFTDILGGNRMNLYTILVVPLHPREFFGTRIMRKLERPVLCRIKEAIKRGEINSIFSD